MNIDIIETMKQALEALDGATIHQRLPEHHSALQETQDAITNLRAAIEAAEKQEPVAWMTHHNNTSYGFTLDVSTASRWKKENRFVLALHPAPTQPDSEQVKDAEKYRKERDELMHVIQEIVKETTEEWTRAQAKAALSKVRTSKIGEQE